MKKVICLIIMVLMGIVFLTGCESVQNRQNVLKETTEEQTKTTVTMKQEAVEENIVGTWNCVLSNEDFNESYTFNEDKTYIYEIGNTKTMGTYSLEDKVLNLTSEGYGKESYKIFFNYEKESNNKTYDLVFMNIENNTVEIELEKK